MLKENWLDNMGQHHVTGMTQLKQETMVRSEFLFNVHEALMYLDLKVILNSYKKCVKDLLKQLLQYGGASMGQDFEVFQLFFKSILLKETNIIKILLILEVSLCFYDY